MWPQLLAQAQQGADIDAVKRLAGAMSGQRSAQ